MSVEEIREYCLLKKGVTEGFPFDEVTLVFKVAGKMFLLTSLDSNPVQFNVKCDPQKAIELREKYDFVQPGYHMSKVHWNTVDFNSDASDKMICGWIDDSYDLVVKSLTKKAQAEINGLEK